MNTIHEYDQYISAIEKKLDKLGNVNRNDIHRLHKIKVKKIKKQRDISYEEATIKYSDNMARIAVKTQSNVRKKLRTIQVKKLKFNKDNINKIYKQQKKQLDKLFIKSLKVLKYNKYLKRGL